ncbi:hypothetical protein DFH29DRAFT_934655 [Suillus ampliporus]|nr:hypothetical protein DFH29DRAFT_934655 [Suillus ampliporus]
MMSSSILNSNFNRSVDSRLVDITGDLPSSTSFTDPMITPSSRLSSMECIKAAVKILRDGHISILDFMLKILDPSEACFAYNCDRIFNCSRQEKTSVDVGKPPVGKLEKMFDCLFADSGGTLDSITPEFLLMWDLNSTIQNAVVSKAPVLKRNCHGHSTWMKQDRNYDAVSSHCQCLRL